MTAAVEIDDETESKLEELRTEIKLETGEEVTQRELLARLVQSAVDSRSEFVDSFADDAETLSDEDLARFNDGMISSGVETDEADIDDVLYE